MLPKHGTKGNLINFGSSVCPPELTCCYRKTLIAKFVRFRLFFNVGIQRNISYEIILTRQDLKGTTFRHV